jgi:hypothetical protein
MFLAKNDSDILSAFLVMVELRPHLSESQYLEQVKLQMLEGYQLLIASDKDLVVRVAGFLRSVDLLRTNFGQQYIGNHIILNASDTILA